LLGEAGMSEMAWLPGERDDVTALFREMDIFVLPSLAEGISNTILEAMASGLPIVATDVGGNGELIEAGRTGILVPRSDSHAMAEAIRRYVDDPEMRRQHGVRARARCEEKFSIQTMVQGYAKLYDSLALSTRY
jgi:glycosyltransferase involved in cell wall biosynthesis